MDVAGMDLVTGYSWFCSSAGYAMRTNPTGGPRIRMHRIIMGLSEDDPRKVDHANHDPLDNRRSNLRIADKSQNAANSRRHPNGSSRYKGVSWGKGKRRPDARITVNGKKRHLGYFDTEEEAALAHNDAALAAWGEFAYLNDVEASE